MIIVQLCVLLVLLSLPVGQFAYSCSLSERGVGLLWTTKTFLRTQSLSSQGNAFPETSSVQKAVVL